MRRKRRLLASEEELPILSEINLTPLIDLAFALLIIFMITAPLLDLGSIDLDLPEASSAPAATKDTPAQHIVIDRNGQYYWGEEAVDLAGLDMRLALLNASGKVPVMAIRADKNVPYAAVVAVIDRLKIASLMNISLETQIK